MRKILILDDEENVLSILKRALDGNEVDVIATSRIERARIAIQKASFDVVITDLRLLGDEGGFDFLSYVKKKRPEIGVIIITGYGSQEVEEEAYRRGAYCYLEKPFDLRILKQKLKELGI